MTYTRIYADANGETHLQDVSVDMKTADHASSMSAIIAAKGVIFRTSASEDYFVDWHNAPRRQYVITLAGAVEIGLGDGSVHRFGPGEGILAEDLTGKGHTTRAVGNEPRITVTIPLAG